MFWLELYSIAVNDTSHIYICFLVCQMLCNTHRTRPNQIKSNQAYRIKTYIESWNLSPLHEVEVFGEVDLVGESVAIRWWDRNWAVKAHA